MPHTHLPWPNSYQIQNNACSNAANSGTLAGGVAQCQTQENACNEAASSSKKRAALDFGSASKVKVRTSANVQKFTGTLGGAAPAVIQGSGERPFSVNGATFVNEAAALQRSCSVGLNFNLETVFF
jgi:hypothetical protein